MFFTTYGNKDHASHDHGPSQKYLSSCPDIVKVDRDGTINAKNPGSATVYIQDIGGKWCTMEVIVK